MKLTVKNTVKFSLIVQLITGIITLYGLFITLDEKHNILRGILGLETLVQFVELAFYIWIAYASVKLPNMTPRRYIDWMITTPIMLLVLVLAFLYNTKGGPLKFSKFLTMVGFIYYSHHS